LTKKAIGILKKGDELEIKVYDRLLKVKLEKIE